MSESNRPGTALAIQGGAMRSIYCVGAVRGLMESGRLQNLRRLHVSSAGCVAGLLLIESKFDIDRYSQATADLLKVVATRRFIDRRRVWRMVDVEFLVDAMFSVTGTSVGSLKQIGIEFEVSLTDSRGVSSYISISDCASDAELRAVFIATMAIPLAYPRQARVAGRVYFDGGIGDPLPVVRALEFNDITHVYAVSSVSPGLLGREATTTEGRILRLTPSIPDGLRHQMLAKNALGALADRILEHGVFRDAVITRIAPPRGSEMGSRFEIDRDHLARLDAMGYSNAISAVQEERCSGTKYTSKERG